MTYVGAYFVVIGFVLLMYKFKLIDRSIEVISNTKEALNVLRDNELDDENKEKILQRSAIRMFSLLAILIFGSIISLSLPLFIVWLVSEFQIFTFNGVLNTLVQWKFIGYSTLIGILMYFVVRKFHS